MPIKLAQPFPAPTKNTRRIVNSYAVVFLLCLLDLLYCEPFFERRDASKTKATDMSVQRGRYGVVFFSTAGSFGLRFASGF